MLLLLSFFPLFVFARVPFQDTFHAPALQPQTVRLKSIYYRPPSSYLQRYDVLTTAHEEENEALQVLSMYKPVSRPRGINQLRQLGDQGKLMRWPSIATYDTMAFDTVWGPVPDISHRPSVLALAIMTNNAYTSVNESNGPDWYELGPPWDVVSVCGSGSNMHKLAAAALTRVAHLHTELNLWLGFGWYPGTCLRQRRRFASHHLLQRHKCWSLHWGTHR